MVLPHTLSVIEGEMRALAAAVNAMGGQVCEQLTNLLEAIRCHDSDALRSVIARDAEVDAAQGRLDKQLIALLAKTQPVARDLRAALAAQRVALELERSGDHVKRIAKQLLKIDGLVPAACNSHLIWFGGQALGQLQRALMAYVSGDAKQAQEAWADDSNLDRMYQRFLSELLERMREHREWVDNGARLMSAAKSMERIGDHATNIAEEVRFVALGAVLPTRRSTE